MSEIIKYYSNYLNNLNKKYDEYTKNYITEFVEFKIPVFSCSLTRNDLNSVDCINNFSNNNAFVNTQKKIEELNEQYLNITKELKGMFIEQSKYVDSFQKKIDELNDENKELLSRSTNIKDTSATSKPFFENERLLYYRSLIYIISVVIGIIFLLYMLQATPFIEVASSVATNTKNLAENAAKGAKGLVDNATTQNPDGTESNNMVRNIIIFVLISAVIISVFYFVIYVLRKVNPPIEKTNTEKEIKRIADSCLRDKSESWVNTQLEKLKTFLTNKKQIN
jgi:beta-lactamase regulating signal transducer with metallopeptidase domain